MALKTLMLKHKLDNLRAVYAALVEKDVEFATRENELAADIEAASTEEEQTVVEAAVDQFNAEQGEHDAEKKRLASQISELEGEIAEAEEQQAAPPALDTRDNHNKNTTRERTAMTYNTRYRDMTMEARGAFVEREDVKDFLRRARELIGSGRRDVTGVNLTIPDTMLGLIRTEAYAASKLVKFVRVANLPGTARQNILGAIPEGVWTETCGKLNELDFAINQITADGYKVGGYIAMCNAMLEDSDINLAGEIISMISGAIAKALDKAILFGTGVKMPTGIVTRLAQTSQPDSWDANAPEWTDLHTTLVQTIDAGNTSGVAFFAALLGALGKTKAKYSGDGLFWVMNKKTHMDILVKALNFNAAGALVAGVNTMPIIGGEIVEFEDDEIADYEIIGGYGGNYPLVQRAGMTFGQSEHVRFIDDQTVFKGTARYDGKPVAGEAFTVINYSNTNPTTSKPFPLDYANSGLNALGVTAAAASTTGKTVLTVTGAIAASPTLKYKANAGNVEIGAKPSGTWTALTSGTTEIAAAAGTPITVVELDGNGRIVSAGTVAAVPKA